MKLLKILLIGALLLPVPQAIMAAESWYLGVQLGQAILNGDAGNMADDGISLGTFAGFRFNSHLSLETALLYPSHDDEVEDPGDYTIDMLSFTFGPKFSTPVGRNVELYAGGGLGIYIVDLKYAPEGQPGTPRKEDDGESGIYGCAGINFPMKEHMRIGIDFAYHHVFENEVLDGDMITMTVRLGFDL